MNTLMESGRVKIPDQVRFQVNLIHNGNFMMTQTQDNLVVMKKNVVLARVIFFIFIGYHIKDFKIMRIAMILKVINLCNIYSVDGYKDNCELEIELREELTTASSEPCTHNSQRVNG